MAGGSRRRTERSRTSPVGPEGVRQSRNVHVRSGRGPDDDRCNRDHCAHYRDRCVRGAPEGWLGRSRAGASNTARLCGLRDCMSPKVARCVPRRVADPRSPLRRRRAEGVARRGLEEVHGPRAEAGRPDSSRAATATRGRLGWSRQPDLNRRPTVYETVALPTELCRPGRRGQLLTARDSWGQARERLPTVAPTVSRWRAVQALLVVVPPPLLDRRPRLEQVREAVLVEGTTPR